MRTFWRNRRIGNEKDLNLEQLSVFGRWCFWCGVLGLVFGTLRDCGTCRSTWQCADERMLLALTAPGSVLRVGQPKCHSECRNVLVGGSL